MIKALILDLHGVLVTKFPLDEYIEAVKNFLKAEGEDEGTYERWKNGFGTMTAAMEYHGLKSKYLIIMDKLPVYSDKDPELVEMLFNSPFILFLVTNSSRNNALATLKEAGYGLGMFKKIITGNDVERGKPELEMYNKILLNNSFKPEEYMVIGDRITDIIPAAKLGMNALLVGKEEFKGWLYASIKVRQENSSI